MNLFLTVYQRAQLEKSEHAIWVEEIGPAIVPDTKANPNKKLIAAVATFAGFFLSVVLVLPVNVPAGIRLR